MAAEAVAGPTERPESLSPATRRGLVLIATAAGLGMLGDLLLNTHPWGVNLSLWVAATAALIGWWGPRFGLQAAVGARLLLLPAVGFAATFAWRDSALLALMNAAVVLACLGLTPLTTATNRFWHAGVGDYLNAWLHGTARGIAAFALPVLVQVQWPAVTRRVTWVWVGPALRGTALSIPVLTFFANFLLSADPIFQRAMADLFRIDWWEVLWHVVVIAAGCWVGGGIVWHALSPLPAPAPAAGAGGWRVGVAETAIVLNALSLMLLLFIAVQVQYLFGGASVVEASTTLTYAEYARRGFFELVTVGAAALIGLVLAEAATVRTGRLQEAVFRASAGLLVVLVLTVLASAVQRMLIYQQQFGLTELRVYTVAFMVWMAACFLWFTATTLTGRGRWFAVGALCSALLVGAALNVANVDRAITAANLGRPDFDPAYHAFLGADAVPVLLEALPGLPAGQRGHLARCLLNRWGGVAPAGDWRSWNAARDEAAQLMAGQAAELQRLATEPHCRGRERRIPS